MADVLGFWFPLPHEASGHSLPDLLPYSLPDLLPYSLPDSPDLTYSSIDIARNFCGARGWSQCSTTFPPRMFRSFGTP